MENQRRAETNKKMFCNCCGKEIRTHYGLPEEGVCTVHTDWGYFRIRTGKAMSLCSVKNVTMLSLPALYCR